MMDLCLDDLRTTPEGFERVHSYEEFIAYLQRHGLSDFVSFDHDLDKGLSNYDYAEYLVDYCLDHQLSLPKFIMHSQNPVGRTNIEQVLANFKRNIKF